MNYLLSFLSFLIVGFGQPVFSSVLSLAAAFFGYALFFKVLLDIPSAKNRFWAGYSWFTAVQMVQLSWLLTHPYWYIYAVHFVFASIYGLQFGIFSLFMIRTNLDSLLKLLGLASLWTLIEWSRLFVLSGLSWNPAGIALSGNLYTAQMASVWGVFGLSFWVMLCNLLLVRGKSVPLWVAAVVLPFVVGFAHVKWHENAAHEYEKDAANQFNAILVQTAFPIEEIMDFKTPKSMVLFVFEEWEQILKITKKHLGKPVDLVVLPEYTVPFGTYSFVFPYESVKQSFAVIYGPESLKKLPPLEWPLAEQKGNTWMVNNAYWGQAIANVFESDLVAGLEDAEESENGGRTYYSAAQFFAPQQMGPLTRYAKRILVPMGEYIPFSFCKKLAESYGIGGSFTCGTCAHAVGSKRPFGMSICYEETFSDLMRDNKVAGAQMLVNLTSDVWYPNSFLPQQHLDHAKLRTIENGFPLLRSCNTGITCALDSLGRQMAILDVSEWTADSLYVDVPTYHYNTIYGQYGDKLIVSLSVLLFGGGLAFGLLKMKELH